MAWRNFGWVWNVVGVQGGEYTVLIYLADQADDSGLTPLVKVDKIQRNCNLSRRSVFVYLKRLEKKGFIKRSRQYRANGISYDANKYQLDKNRYFPANEYLESMLMWKKILHRLKQATMEDADRHTLAMFSQVFLQKNTRVLNIVTNNELFHGALMRNLTLIKDAAAAEKLPIKRFEAFQTPVLKS